MGSFSWQLRREFKKRQMTLEIVMKSTSRHIIQSIIKTMSLKKQRANFKVGKKRVHHPT